MKKSLLVLLLSCVYLFSLTAEKFVETYSTNNVKVSVTIENCHYVITDMYTGGVKLDFAEIGYIKGDNKYKQENGKWKKVTELTCVNSNSLPEMKDISNPSGTLFSKIGSEYNTKKVNTIKDTPYIPLSSDVLEDLSDGTFVLVGTKKLHGSNFTCVVSLKPNSLFMNAEYKIAIKLTDTESFQQSVFERLYKLSTENFGLVNYNAQEKENIVNEFATLISATIYSNTELIDGKYPVYSPGNVCENTCEYLRCHLNEMYTNNYPVLQSLISINSDFDYYSYKDLSSTEKNNIANAANKYINWAVEYKTWILDKASDKAKIFEEVNKEWINDGDSVENYYRSTFPEYTSDNNSIPYAKGGADTPRTFWYKLRLHKNKTNSKNVLPTYGYSDSSYNPGGTSDLYKNAGVDSLGLLTGAISMSSAAEKILNIRNNNKPAEKLLLKNKEVSNITNDDISKTMEEGWKDCRFSVEDIDNFSCVIPYYSEIQKGDILVKYKDGNTSVAVVIKVDTQENKNKNDITVIYVEEKDGGCCKKAKWSELEDSDSYTPRKLVVNNIKEKKDFKGKDFASVVPAKIEIDIEKMYEENQASIPENYKWRFIPNTGECLVLEDITFKLYNNAGVNLSKTNNDLYKVMLTGAKDRDYGISGNGNIYTNTSTDIDFFEIDAEGRSSTVPKRATKKDDIYKLSNYIQLKIGKDGYLKKTGGEQAIIGVRPVSASKAYPGDDFLLTFDVCYGNKTQIQEVQNKDYIAFYDKKMLWRANLYINQKEEALGNMDWNDVHTWNAPSCADDYQKMAAHVDDKKKLDKWWSADWGFNEWNDLSINGGQIAISSWTRIPTAGNEGSNVFNSVAYGYGCGDEVKTFNQGLADLSAAMIEMKDNNENYPPSGTLLTGQTTAPDGKWKFYIFPAETSQYKYEDIKLLDKEPADFFKRASNESKVKIPGFSTYWLDKGKYNSAQCGYTLGIDCSGLVHRSTKYEGSRYRSNKKDLHNINAKMFMGKYNTGKQNANKEDIWEDEVDPTYSIAIFKATSDNPWILDEYDDNGFTATAKKHQSLISHAVPGDILVNEGHVVFVQNLNYAEGSVLITDYSQVDVIHSTQKLKGENDTWMVQKGRWDNIQNVVTGYQLRRLKRN